MPSSTPLPLTSLTVQPTRESEESNMLKKPIMINLRNEEITFPDGVRYKFRDLPYDDERGALPIDREYSVPLGM